MAAQLLQARNVDTIKPGAKMITLYDSKEVGLELRIRPVAKGGAKSWSIRYRIHGQQRRWKLGDYPTFSLAEAREMADDVKHGVKLGVDPHAVREAAKRQREADERRVTFGTLTQLYLERVSTPANEKYKRTWKVDRRYLNRECGAWKARLAADITRGDVRGLYEAITARPAPIVANRVIEVLKSVFDFALDRELIIADPTVRCESNKEHKRNRDLTDGEIRQFWHAFSTPSCDYRTYDHLTKAQQEHAAQQAVERADAMAAGFRLRLLTGQRGGEVFNMEWQDLDLKTGWWTIPAEKTKNGLTHRVPLSPPALEIIKAIAAEKGRPRKDKKNRNVDSSFVLDGARGRRQRGVASRATGLPDFIGHDLRKAVATGLGKLGISRFIQGRVLNHADSGVDATYDLYSYATEKRAALEAWAVALYAILEAKESTDGQDEAPNQ